jgi:alanine racemase
MSLPLNRRCLLGALAAAPLAAGSPLLAAPVLSARNSNLTPEQAVRRSAWLEVDPDAFGFNVRHTQSLLGSARLCAIMKANAYGAGIDLLIPSVRALGISAIGIASNDEARVARERGFRGQIMRVRTGTPDEIEDGFGYGIEELVGDLDAARLMSERWAARRRKGRLSVHLALNADGMSRNGLELSSRWGKSDAAAILAIPVLNIAGLMTHYPTEDRDDILRQLARFEQDIAWLRANGLTNPQALRHSANTFATLHHPQTRLDMARVGGAIYGDVSSDFLGQFRPILTLKARVAAINHFPADQTVSYDRTYRLERESWLANIPIGYSDGFRRSLSHANQPAFANESRNATEVLINGKRFPVIGRVTMNTVMVDITGDQDRIKPGAEVVLFGRQGDQLISQRELESNSSGFGPELLAMLGNSLPRILKPRQSLIP